MGFIKKLKDLFNKNIECGNEIDDHIVFRLKKKWLYLSKNIYVREKNACVIVYRGRMCDVIYTGKYRINGDSIPETFGKAKIEKQNKKGRKIKKIRADIYYVNLEDFKSFAYMSNSPFKSKSTSIGRVKGCLAGTCNVKVLDAGAAIKTLIAHKGSIKNKEIYAKIGVLIGNKINHLIQKNKIPADMVLNNQEYVESILNTDMQEALDKEGFFISNVKLKSVDFAKKHQGKVNEYLSTHRRNIPNVVDVEKALGMERKNTIQVPVSVSVQTPSKTTSMQTYQNPGNMEEFSMCKVCKKKNVKGAKICINCGTKFD